MFAVEADLARGMAVVLMAGPGCDRDWLAYIEAIRSLNRGAPRDVRPVLVQMSRASAPMPSALVRKELAALRALIRADAINVIIVESATLRAAQTALDWLRKPHYETSSHAHLEPALAHAERIRGRPMPELRELAARVAARSNA